MATIVKTILAGWAWLFSIFPGITRMWRWGSAYFQKIDPVARFIDDLCRSMTRTSLSYRQTGGVRGFHVHDATTLAYLFYPETLMLRRAQVHVETEGESTRGQTIFDDRHVAKKATNAWVALQVDADNLLAIMAEDLKVLFDSD